MKQRILLAFIFSMSMFPLFGQKTPVEGTSGQFPVPEIVVTAASSGTRNLVRQNSSSGPVSPTGPLQRARHGQFHIDQETGEVDDVGEEGEASEVINAIAVESLRGSENGDSLSSLSLSGVGPSEAEQISHRIGFGRRLNEDSGSTVHTLASSGDDETTSLVLDLNIIEATMNTIFASDDEEARQDWLRGLALGYNIQIRVHRQDNQPQYYNQNAQLPTLQVDISSDGHIALTISSGS